MRGDGRAVGYRGKKQLTAPDAASTVVAFYLPQFHPIEENDQWWGPGFTEWRNVTRALPQFEGHPQPRLPGELGFYDLRLPGVMQQQVRLAKQYGVGAFCFYVYWFAGRRVLERPVDSYLSDPTLELPFCLCWANEPWTRRWDGRAEEVLLEQQHSPEDDLAFISSLVPFLQDPRYLRVDGKPLVVVYRLELFPDPAATAARWRNYCQEAGIGEIHLACVESFRRVDPRPLGFDSAIEFPPNLTQTFGLAIDRELVNPGHEGEILDWRAMADQFRARKRPDYPLFRGVNPGWDNEPRRPGRGRSFVNNSVRGYETWLRNALVSTPDAKETSASRLVFINAWNEWAEGAYLEPDTRLGYALLEATHRAQLPPRPRQNRPCAVIHAHYPELLAEMLECVSASDGDWRIVVTTSSQLAAQVDESIERWTQSTRAHQGKNHTIETRVVENRGRDILPFLRVADELIDEGEDLILKLHTKRSPHLDNGDSWRSQLLDNLIAPARVTAVLRAFHDDPLLGMVGPSGHALDLSMHQGGNAESISLLRRRLGVHTEPGLFFAGSMFWVRLGALQPLLDAHLDEFLFEEERGQVDGTLAHALERMFPAVVATAGFRISATDDPGAGIPAVEPDYPFVP